MGINKVTGRGSEKWRAIKRRYQDRELAEFLMIQYVKLGGYSAMEKEFEATKRSFSERITKFRKEIYNDKPYLVDLFDDALKYNMYEKPKEAQDNEKRYEFGEDVFKILPDKLEYTEFINRMCKYNTREKSVYELIRMANRHDKKIYEIIKGKERIIRC